MTGTKIGIEDYNAFCNKLKAGNILYNMNPSNLWGEYILVAWITSVCTEGVATYAGLLVTLEKENGKYTPTKNCVSLVPSESKHIPFLKIVGSSDFELVPVLDNVNVNVGLVAIVQESDLHRYTQKLSIRKPKVNKYGKDGKPVIKKLYK